MYDVRYEYVPAAEQVKKYVVGKLEEMSALLAEIQRKLFLQQNPKFETAQFVSEVISFYTYLAPKMHDYLRMMKDKANKEDTDNRDAIVLVMQSGEYSLMNFDIVELTEIVTLFTWLNYFCELYGLTSTKTPSKALL